MSVLLQKMSNVALERLQEQVQEEINSRQKECKHRRIVYKHGANTGNYSPSDDSYWVDITCLDCGKRYTIYDHEEGYNMKYIGEDLKATKEDYEVLKKFGKEK